MIFQIVFVRYTSTSVSSSSTTSVLSLFWLLVFTVFDEFCIFFELHVSMIRNQMCRPISYISTRLVCFPAQAARSVFIVSFKKKTSTPKRLLNKWIIQNIKNKTIQSIHTHTHITHKIVFVTVTDTKEESNYKQFVLKSCSTYRRSTYIKTYTFCFIIIILFKIKYKKIWSFWKNIEFDTRK